MDTQQNMSLELATQLGRKLLAIDNGDAVEARNLFNEWDEKVAQWLDDKFPGSGLSAGWASNSGSPLLQHGELRADSNAWFGFRISVQRRLKWLGTNCIGGGNDQPRMAALQSALDSGQSIFVETDPHAAHRSFEEWASSVKSTLRRLYPDTAFDAEWLALPYSTLIRGGVWSKKNEEWDRFREVITERIAWLAKVKARELQAMRQDGAITQSSPSLSNRIFVVHGHNDGLKEATARYLTKLKLDPVILHEQPNKGRTIIEKFVDYADVGFAVVLVTSDDQGGAKDGDRAKNGPRARQNVILELGYFLGLLGRAKVCAIYESGVELPSDYNGVLWIEFDAAGAWKLQLAKEIKEAGLSIDMNDAI